MSGIDFDDREIDIIIKSLRATYGAKLFGDCGGVFSTKDHKEAFLVPTRLNERNSISPTDVIFAGAKISTEKHFNTVMKFWFNWDNLSKAARKQAIESACPAVCTNAKKEKVLASFNIKPKTQTAAGINEAYSVFLDTINDKENEIRALEYEARVYAYITENIIVNGLSPCFIPLLSTNECKISDIKHAISAVDDFPGRQKIVDKLEFIQNITNNNPDLKFKFLLTGTGRKIESMHGFLELNIRGLDKVEIAKIVFQLFYCLYIFDAYDITHFDLHFGNILVETLDTALDMTFKINRQTITFSSKYIVKMYDYDAASVKPLGPNPMTNLMLMYGRTDFRQGADFSQVLCNLSGFKTPAVKDVLTTLGLYSLANTFLTTGALKPKANPVVKISITVNFQKHLDSLTPYGTTDKNVNFYRVDMVTMQGFPTVMKQLQAIFGAELDSFKKIMMSRNVKGDVYVYSSQNCWLSNDYDVDYNSFFEDPAKFALFKALIPEEPKGRGKVMYTYTFKRPRSLFVPPTNLGDIFDAIKERQPKRRSSGRARAPARGRGRDVDS